jgi:ligand-binding SRPBCC domain-containing protein
MTVRFECVTEVGARPHRVYELSLDVGLHLRSMARSGERAVGGVTEGLLGLGDEVTWRAWHFGLPWTMTSRVTEVDPPHRFVDQQVRGPFRRFRHEHLFQPLGVGGTWMVDRVELTAPLGPLGRLAEVLVVGRYLQRLIEQRNQVLAAEAATP